MPEHLGLLQSHFILHRSAVAIDPPATRGAMSGRSNHSSQSLAVI